MTSGSTTLARPASADPRAVAPSTNTERATGSRSASATTSSSRVTAASPRSVYSATNAGPEATDSTWPSAPQGQRRPAAAATGTCPTWPAAARAPPWIRPSHSRAPPTPVPTATSTTVEPPRAAPRRYSPRAWAWTSLTTVTGTPSSAVRCPRRSVPAQPGRESVAESTSPVSGSTTPALPTPTPTTSWSAPTSRASSTAVSSTARAPPAAGVGRLAWVRTAPSAVTVAAAVLVPPMSRATATRLTAARPPPGSCARARSPHR